MIVDVAIWPYFISVLKLLIVFFSRRFFFFLRIFLSTYFDVHWKAKTYNFENPQCLLKKIVILFITDCYNWFLGSDTYGHRRISVFPKDTKSLSLLKKPMFMADTSLLYTKSSLVTVNVLYCAALKENK